MALTDFLTSGQAPSANTTPTNSYSQMPDWWNAAEQGLISQASNYAATPYQTNPGPQVASMDPMTMQAEANVNQYEPNINSDLTNAADIQNNVGSGFNADKFNQYLNPYMSNVTDRIAQLADQNLMENVLPGVNNTFTKAGQFGSTQNANITNQAIRNNQQTISDAQANALESGFQGAMNNYQAGDKLQMQAGDNLTSLANTNQNIGTNQTGVENALGQQNQALTQKNLDTATSNFNAQKQYPLQQMGVMESVLNGAKPAADTSAYATGIQTAQQTAGGTGNNQSPLQTLPAAAGSIIGALPTVGGALSSLVGG